jgi:hypothetical protein
VIGATPWGPNKPVYRCNNFNPTSAFYGAGILTTHPQFCDPISWRQNPVLPTAATNINVPQAGWSVGGQDVYRCSLFTFYLDNHYGVGVLTTLPQYCDGAGVPEQPMAVQARVATDTGIQVP